MVLDTLGRSMGAPKPCKLCEKKFTPSGVRSVYCKKCYSTTSLITKTLGAMKARCAQAHMNRFKYYKGLSVCEEWSRDTHSFIVWSLKNNWRKGGFIDRIDGKKGYSPDNCRWTTAKGNSHNRLDGKTDFTNKIRCCWVCGTWKPFDSFHRSKNSPGGYTYECKVCKAQRDLYKYKRSLNA
jgi:hypothetical protein